MAENTKTGISISIDLDLELDEAYETVSAAIARARSLATPRDMIYIGGSNFIVAEALAEL